MKMTSPLNLMLTAPSIGMVILPSAPGGSGQDPCGSPECYETVSVTNTGPPGEYSIAKCVDDICQGGWNG